MAFRLLSCLAAVSIITSTLPAWAQTRPADNTSSQARSYVQGRGAGTVTLKPTHLRISVPIRVVEDTSWDATEKLRQVRQEVVDRATEMGALEGSIRTVGFLCGDASSQTAGLIAGGINRNDVAQIMARCYMFSKTADAVILTPLFPAA